jgi:hypothetical protein
LWLDTSGSDYTLKTWDGSAWREIVVTSAMIKDGAIVNDDINASAAIAHTKLANITAGSVLLGNASNVPTATALSGDVTVSDAGVTAIGSGVILNADVNASAAIAGTKVSPDFGSQNVVTTGTVTAGSFPGPVIDGTILEDVFTITDGADFEVDPGNGSIQLITLGANRTPKATNFTAGESITLMVDDGTAHTLTWTDTTWGASGVEWTGGAAPDLATSGYTVLQFWKVSTQVYGALVGEVA